MFRAWRLEPKVTDLTGYGDKATVATATLTYAGHTIRFGAIYLLKGANFLSFGNTVLGGQSATAEELEAQATTSLGRMP